MSGIGKRALITGIHGFTGRYMARELAADGYQVFGLGRQPASQPDYFQLDLRNADRLTEVLKQVRPHVVIHLAAIAFVGYGNANAFYQVNAVGTRNLLQALCRCASSLDAVLIASSANVYGNNQAGKLKENTPPNPENDYAVSKLMMEYIAKLWMDKLPLFITRPFNYTGVGQDNNFLLPKIVSHYRNKSLTIELGNIDVWRDFTDVRALVRAYRHLLQVKPLGEIINICSGSMYSLSEIVALCEKITAHHLQIKINPALVRQNEVKTLCGDATKLQALLNDWKTPPLETTLRWMLESE
ncbi:GDP-mannose 4,6-dehydratase [Pantoea sp. B65]|uniref:GDP-mannose 4,6-dehydratase n=1 Tax=Pantoea sp. B65 TaxID=2813359 RepID=UPI0039B6D22D